MSSKTSWRPAITERVAGDELLFEYRERRALKESERTEQKRADTAAQSSALNSADLRIRAWEKVHELRMPSDPSHPALASIAAVTQLTLEEIRSEQRLRLGRSAPAVA
jgi:hypothetical protein